MLLSLLRLIRFWQNLEPLNEEVMLIDTNKRIASEWAKGIGDGFHPVNRDIPSSNPEYLDVIDLMGETVLSVHSGPLIRDPKP